MRTTLNIDDGLLADAKRLAAERGMTVTALVEESLRERVLLERDPRTGAQPPADLPVATGGLGLRPGVNYDSNAEVRDLMDEGVPLHKLR